MARLNGISNGEQKGSLALAAYKDLLDSAPHDAEYIVPLLNDIPVTKLVRLRSSRKGLRREGMRLLKNEEQRCGTSFAAVRIPTMPCVASEAKEAQSVSLDTTLGLANHLCSLGKDGCTAIHYAFQSTAMAKDKGDSDNQKAENGGQRQGPRPCSKSPSVHVARSVSKKEVREVLVADAACKKEWSRLEDIGCWDISRVKSWSQVKREADKRGDTIHVGSLHELCMEKGSELPEGDPQHKIQRSCGLPW